MKALIILDNAFGVPPNVAGIFGLDNFAELIIKKRSLRQRLADLSKHLGWDEVVFLDGGAIRSNVVHRIDRLSRAGGGVVYVPSYVHLAASDTEACDFLEKIAYTTQSAVVHDPVGATDGAPAGTSKAHLFVLRDQELRSFLAAPHADARHAELQQLAQSLPSFAADFSLLDLRSTEEFLHAVTSTFDARHFNRVSSVDKYTITKHSTNAEKLQQEYEFFSWLPASMRRFFIEPFDFTHDAQGASYRMERLLVPDFALQWLHNSVRQADFEQFVRHIFYFLGERATRPCELSEGRLAADNLYINKVVQRVDALLQHPGFQGVAAHADHAFGGVKQLLARYLALYAKWAPRRKYDKTAIIHGDLCFSNILYNGALGTLKLIDPRGAATREQLYADPFYDLAKLSHSIEGKYDYINAGQFSIELDSVGKPALRINTPPRHAELAIFRKYCQALEAPPRLVRIYEASLFISMTPLHIESPLKVLAFLMNADLILSSVEDNTQWET